MKSFQLNIEYGNIRKNAGEIIHIQKNRYKVRIDQRQPLIDQIGTLFYLFGIFLFSTLFESVDVEKEKKFCTKLDEYVKKEFRKFLKL